MIVRDYIREKLNLWGVELSDSFLAVELAKINVTAEEKISENTPIDLFFYNIIPDILLSPTSINEGGYSVSFDRKAMESYYLFLCKKLNKNNLLINKHNEVKDITSRW